MSPPVDLVGPRCAWINSLLCRGLPCGGSHPRSRQPRVNGAWNRPTHGSRSWQGAGSGRSGSDTHGLEPQANLSATKVKGLSGHHTRGRGVNQGSGIWPGTDPSGCGVFGAGRGAWPLRFCTAWRRRNSICPLTLRSSSCAQLSSSRQSSGSIRNRKDLRRSTGLRCRGSRRSPRVRPRLRRRARPGGC